MSLDETLFSPIPCAVHRFDHPLVGFVHVVDGVPHLQKNVLELIDDLCLLIQRAETKVCHYPERNRRKPRSIEYGKTPLHPIRCFAHFVVCHRL